MARPGIEPRASDLRVRCPTDCATRACQDVKQKSFAIKRAAREHGQPEYTLRWRLANDKPESVKRMDSTFFTRAQEEMLAEHCVSMAYLGYGFTRWQMIDMAKIYVK